MILKLTRDKFNETETLGTLSIDGVPMGFSLELPWRNNRRQISCIPEGEYDIKMRTSPKYGRHVFVKNVPGRKYILIHAGNFAKDTRGCIYPGLHRGEHAVWDSRKALDEILNELPTAGAKLTITK